MEERSGGRTMDLDLSLADFLDSLSVVASLEVVLLF